MRHMIAIALFSVLVACSENEPGETVSNTGEISYDANSLENASGGVISAAEVALENLTRSRKLIAGVNTISEAEEIESSLSEAGESYLRAIEVMSLEDGSDVELAQGLAKIKAKIGAEYLGVMTALIELQERNTKAFLVLEEEMKAFEPKRQ